MVIPFVSIWPNLYTPVPEYRSQQYPKYIIEMNLVKTGEVPVLIARLQKYVEYTRALHLLERSFFCEGVRGGGSPPGGVLDPHREKKHRFPVECSPEASERELQT